MKKIKLVSIIILLILIISGYGVYKYGRSYWVPIYYKLVGSRTLDQVVSELDLKVKSRLFPYFKKAGVNYTPEKVTFIALKEEKILEVWGETKGNWNFIRSYPILAASGKPGPKLKEGDKQVPEGIYKIVGLNPNSSYYLSMLINYPNNFDLKKAALDKRSNLGGSIFIHGKDVSIGCIAVGDEAIEDLFLLVAKTGAKNTKVIIAPYDFRKRDINSRITNLSWSKELYNLIDDEIRKYVRN